MQKHAKKVNQKSRQLIHNIKLGNNTTYHHK